MKVRQDKYNLSKSSITKINEDLLDIKVDLKLKNSNNKINIGSSISGRVTDNFNRPLKEAMVKLIDAEFNLITYVVTNDEGTYSIKTISYSESYAIRVILIGKLSSQSKFFKLNIGEEKIFNFVLNEDNSFKFGTITGVIEDKNTLKEILGSVIWLYKFTNNKKILVAITYSDKNGEFLFGKLTSGRYSIVVFNTSYFSEEILQEIKEGEILNLKVSLTYNLNASKASISGVITDENNVNISEATVTLYSMENNKIIPIAFTITNSNGIYIFNNIPKGNYLIKSNKAQIIISNYNSITSYDNTTTTFANTTIPINSNTFDAALGITAGSAKVDKSTNFISGIGGKDNGVTTLTFKLNKEGLYNLSIQYIASDKNRPLKIDVNGVNTGTVYIVPKTNGNKVLDAKVFTLPNIIQLNLNNRIKFYGDGKNNSPDLGKIFLNLVTYIFKISEGEFANGAKLDQDSKLIYWIGGQKNGAVTMTVNVNVTGSYKLEIQYLSVDGISALKIDVNGINTGSIYTLPETTGWSIVDSKLFTISNNINLNLGNNKIKFYGDGKNFAPSLGNLYVTLKTATIVTNTLPNKIPSNNTLPNTQKDPNNTNYILPTTATIPALYSYNANKGIFTGGAKIDTTTKFVTALGGKTDGATTLTVSVEKEGIYNLFGIYICEDIDKTLSISVNKTSTKYNYQLPKTNGKTLSDVKIFIIVIELKAGYNTLKFHGDGKNLAPDLGHMILFTNDLEKKEPVLQYYINERFG